MREFGVRLKKNKREEKGRYIKQGSYTRFILDQGKKKNAYENRVASNQGLKRFRKRPL